MTLVQIGRLGRPHGVKGELVLNGTDLTPLELHAVHAFTWKGERGETRPLTLATARPANTVVLVSFEGVTGRDQAAALVLGWVYAERDSLPDPGPGVAYTFQLIGLDVVTEEGRSLGTLAEVISTAAHPVYVVRGAKELLVPATEHVLRKVDLEARTITVRLPAGLEEL
jgi:16S rRNA processing protein RimM